MFYLAIFIGIYSYIIFTLGIFAILTKVNIFLVTTLWFLLLLFFERTAIAEYTISFHKIRFNFKKLLTNPLLLLVILFILQAFVNLIGALGPELAFDALWYHLTLPKLYLFSQSVYHIPGGLLYYSDMPKLGEMLYTGALALGNEIIAKLIHFVFSLLICLALYKLSRKFLNRFISFLVIIIFYSNLVVDWEATTAYIDLIRTFFEILSLWSFILWTEKLQKKWLLLFAMMTGLAITTKVLSLGSFFIFLILLIVVIFIHKVGLKKGLFSVLIYSFISFFIPLPWFIFSYIHTCNPIYPFFSHIYEVNPSSPNPFQFINDLWNLFTNSSDPISPVYLIFLPFLFVTFSKFNKQIKFVVWYSFLSLFLWYFTPQTGGGRFILPYLPAFSFICGVIYSEILKTNREKFYTRVLLCVIVLVSLISIGYRGVANIKFLPVIIGKESKGTFLKNHLNFSFGDFYDTDNYFSKHIKSSDQVLLYGFHNLYYVDFPFIDNSWIEKGDTFDYIATQNTQLPTKFKNWQLTYSNDKTMVQLYNPPKGECNKLCHY
jgi:hypothetical protein